MQANLENLIASRFIARSDVKAVQNSDGHYHPVREKITRADIQAHLAGTQTFGYYHLSADSKCKTICYDLDWRKPNPKVDPPVECWYADDTGVKHAYHPREAWLDPSHPNYENMVVQMRCLAEGIGLRMQRTLGVGVAILNSGSKGFHVYGFLDEPTPAGDVRGAAHAVLEHFGCFERFKGDNFWRHSHTEDGYRDIEIEVFPKQDTIEGKDLGNLLRMPLGVHRKTNRRSFFVDVSTPHEPAHELLEVDPIVALTDPKPWGDTI